MQTGGLFVLNYKTYVTRKLPDSALALLREVSEVAVWDYEDVPVTRERLQAELSTADAIVTMLSDKIDASLLQHAPNLKVIANLAVGFDNIDLSITRSKGITVTNTPDVLTDATADLTFALLLSTARRITEASQFLRAGSWKQWAPYLMAGQDVFGATIGIVGLGRIGEAVARRAKGFSMRVLYHNRHRKPEAEQTLGVQYADLDDLLKQSDFVVLLTPANNDSIGMINEKRLALMKKTACLINVARGAVVDETALYDVLKNRKIFAAGIDVFANEPIAMDHPFLSLDNVVLLPHIGSASIKTRTVMAELTAQNVVAVLSGRPALTPVLA